jgi:hypothetical protein
MTDALHSAPTRRLGKRPPDPAQPRLRFGQHLKVKPRYPLVDPGPASLNLAYPMDENDAWGDCVVAGMDHALQVICAMLGVPRENWTREQILAYYWTQNPLFDPTDQDHGPGSEDDAGMYIQDFLSYLVKEGVILGFGSIDHTDPDEMKAAVWLGLAVPTGEILTRRNLAEKIWDYHPGDHVEGGHCTVTVDYRGGSTDYHDQVSWGDLYGMTPSFIRNSVDEAWFVITRHHVEHPGFRDAFDLEGFAEAYTSLTDRPFPVDVEPGPGPAPVPVPDPVPPAPVMNPFREALDEYPGLAAEMDRLRDHHNRRHHTSWSTEQYVAWRVAAEEGFRT